jgi:class 3 adenylate cyclase
VQDLPTGTVTLLVTDVEGSTQLFDTMGAAYEPIFADHQRLLREVFEQFGGRELELLGDSFLVGFTRARDAVDAALAIQRAVAAHPWPDGLDLRVDIALHTGEPSVLGGKLAGEDLNRALRLVAAAEGGQIVLSQTTAELVRSSLPAGAKLHDLGERTVALGRVERVYELRTDDLRPAASPPRKRALPEGTVTFLFTDIEGSAQLVQRLRDGWGDVHAAHRRLLREAFAASDGQEVDSQGDAFFVAFARARDAVTAAARGQQALAAHAWPEGARVRVRMGIHTGEPSVGEEGYLGLDVIRAARICSAGHGGQVLLSATTRALVAWDELDGIAVIDLGEHRLKDLHAPEQLHQLVIAGLQTDFRPVRTDDAASEDPMPVAGREADLGAQAEAVVRDFRASIEQTVAESLRGVPGLGGDFDLGRAAREFERTTRPSWRKLGRWWWRRP